MTRRLPNPLSVQSPAEEINMGARWQKGSVRLEGKHVKQWVGRFLEDQIVDGQVRRIQKSVRLGTQDQFATKRLAQRELDKLVRPINAAGYRPKHKMTLQQASEKWLREVVAVKFKPSSQASSRSNLKRILETFGRVECTAIRPGDLSTWVARLHNSGLSPVTIHNYITTFKMLWACIQDWEYADHDPLKRVRAPKKDGRKTQPCFTLEQTLEILARATEEPYATMFHILAETGMRGGELCGLFRADFDLDARTIRIGRSAYQGHLQTTKTENADRVIYISSFLAERIKQYTESVRTLRAAVDGLGDIPTRFDSSLRSANGAATKARTLESGSTPDARNPLLFPLPGKLAWDNSDIVLDGLKPIVRAMGIDAERMGLHAFRHHSKSLMIHLGVPEKYRCERQGHSHGGGKMDMIYAHTDLEHHRMYAEMIGAVLAKGAGMNITSAPVLRAETVQTAYAAGAD